MKNMAKKNKAVTKAPSSDTHWNYRMILKNGMIGIHEVYYKGEAPKMCSVEPCGPLGETEAELRDDYLRMKGAIVKPVLEYSDFGKGKIKP